MNLGELLWSPDTGEGIVLFSPQFITADCVTQLDALKDWIEMLRETHDAIFQQMVGEDDEQS